MELNIFKLFGQVAGIGGLALAILFLIFRDIINKKVFKTMSATQSYKIFRMIIVFLFVIALAGIVAWVYSGSIQQEKTIDSGSVINLDSIITFKEIKDANQKMNALDLNVTQDSLKLRFRSVEFKIDEVPIYVNKNIPAAELKTSIINYLNLEKYIQYNGSTPLQDILWKVYINNNQIQDEQQSLASLGVKNNDWVSLGTSIVLFKKNISDTLKIPNVRIPDSIIRNIRPMNVNTNLIDSHNIQAPTSNISDSNRSIRRRLNGQVIPRINR